MFDWIWFQFKGLLTGALIGIVGYFFICAILEPKVAKKSFLDGLCKNYDIKCEEANRLEDPVKYTRIPNPVFDPSNPNLAPETLCLEVRIENGAIVGKNIVGPINCNLESFFE